MNKRIKPNTLLCLLLMLILSQSTILMGQGSGIKELIKKDKEEQSTPIDYSDNSIFISYGTVIFSSQYSLAYERTVYERNIARVKARIMYGKYNGSYPDLDIDEREYRSYIGISGVGVIGLFEIGLGLSHAKFTFARGGGPPTPGIDYNETMSAMTFIGNAGIRYEKDEFLLRAGIGNLELLYFGVGINF